MNLTNQDMDNYVQALSKVSTKVTGKLAYAVARNIRKLSTELVDYQTFKNNTIEKFGSINEKGVYSIEFGTEAYLNYLKEMKEINNLTNGVELQMVSVSDIESSELNAQEILSIDFMIEEEKKDE